MKSLTSKYNESIDVWKERIEVEKTFKQELNEDAASAVNGLIKGIKELYRDKDSSITSGIPQLGKMITRVAVALAGASTVSIVSPVALPLAAVIAVYTSSVIKGNNNRKRRTELINMYQSKVEMFEDKIQAEDNAEAKMQFKKIQSKLKSDLNRLKVIKDREE